jgi:predicted deacylase
LPSQILDTALDVGRLATGRHAFVRLIAPMADGTSTGLPLVVLRGRAARPRIVAIAGVHGDEHDGPAALLDAVDALDPHRLDGTLVVVPIANPPAFRVTRRWNPADAMNMNRIFPADPAGSVTHRLAHVLVDEVIRGADFVLTIHGWTAGSLTVPYAEYTANHATSADARAGASAFGLSYLEPLGLLPGRLMSLVAEMGIAGCEAEVGGEGITLPERSAIAIGGITGVLRQLKVLPGSPDRPSDQRDVTRHEVLATVGGAWRRLPDRRVGERIAHGEPIGRITDLTGEELARVVAPASGVIATMRHALATEPGDLLVVIFADHGEPAGARP